MSLALPLAGAAIAAVNLKVIALTSSLMGLKIALAGTGIGLAVIALGGLATAFFKARGEAKAFQDLITQGGEEEVTKALEKQKELVEKLGKEQQKARGNAKRGAERKLEEAQADLEALQKRFETLEAEKQITEEQKKQNEEKKKSAELIKKQQEETEKLKERFMEVGKSIEQGVVQNLTDAAMGTKTLGEAAISVLNDLKRKLIEVAMEQAVSGLGNFLGTALGNIFAGGGGRTPTPSLTPAQQVSRFTFMKADGGAVRANQPYIVGERQPELFVPRASGTIIPSVPMGGQSVTNNIVINVDASGTAVQGDDANASQFGEQLAAAIQAEIINQKRSGGLLA